MSNSALPVSLEESSGVSASTDLPVRLGLSAFMQPRSLRRPDAWIGHIPFAFWLIEALKPKDLVELGVHTGNSYFSWCQGVQELGYPTRCFAIDTWRGDEHAGAYDESVYRAVQQHNRSYYSSFSELLRSTFDDANSKFKLESVDLLHIDGLHTYEGVRHDYETWLPKLRPGGVVVFHDIAVRDRGFGVFQFWAELVAQKHPSFEFLHSNGLGVLAPKGDPPPEVMQLMDCWPDAIKREQAQHLFGRLGHMIEGQMQTAFAAEIRAEDHARLAELAKHYSAAIARGDGLHVEAKQALDERDNFRTKVQDAERQIESIRLELCAAQTELARRGDELLGLRAELALKGDELSQSRAELGELQERFLARDALKDRLTDWHVQDLQAQVADELGRFSQADAKRAWLEKRYNLVAGLYQTVSKASGKSEEFGVRHAIKGFVSRKYPWLIAKGSPIEFGGANHVRLAVQESGLFDPIHYLSQLPNPAEAASDPLGHFLNDGWKRGLQPNEYFDPLWYRAVYHDMPDYGLPELFHYIFYGEAEGRQAGPRFDPGFYKRSYPDVAEAGKSPLAHFLHFGRYEGRISKPEPHKREGSSFFQIESAHELGRIDRFEARLAHSARASEHGHASEIKIDIIIPVYGGLQQTRRCIESVLRYRKNNEAFGVLYLVDDCGPDPALRALLPTYADENGDVVLLVNEKNEGFIKSVNRAMKASDRDVLLLNADTEVNGDWLDRLCRHAYGYQKVATVTPLSNNATICSFPAIGASPKLPLGRSLAELDKACARANAGRSVDVPTGVGFCMWISRAALDTLGLFDEAYGRGYGEETDFCQKAFHSGWRNLLAGDVFVFHEGSVSFGASAAAEQASGGAMMRERFPDYEASVARWVESDPALPLRFAAYACLIRDPVRPIVLHILHPWGGGTEKQVQEICDRLRPDAAHVVLITRRVARGIELSLLLPDGHAWRKYRMEAASLAECAGIVKRLGVTRVHVHHAVEVISELDRLLVELDVPYDLSVHDYSLVCPRSNLIRKRGMYCGEPDEVGCLECLQSEPAPRSRDIILWRHWGVGLLDGADRVICPTLDVATRLKRYAPHANFVVVPHEADLYHPDRSVQLPSLEAGERLRVAAIGVMAEHKGGLFLLECIERSRLQGLPIDWCLIGEFPDEFKERVLACSKVLSVTGAYESTRILDLIAEADPHLVFYPQHCIETYSYSLSEGFASGRPILAPRLGAFIERVDGVKGCWTYDHRETAGAVLERIMGLRECVLLSGDPASSSPESLSVSDGFVLERDFYLDSYLPRGMNRPSDEIGAT